MIGISALPASIVDWLNEQEYLGEITFLTEYPPQYKAVPLRSPIVSVGVKQITITDHFTENDDHVLVRDEYCRTANIEIVLSIHVPFSHGGRKCHELFTNVVDCLTFSSDLNIIDSHCDSISSDRDTDALVMNAYINIQSDFCPSEEADDHFHSFMDKELLCGSHIRDTEIHISQQEREKWNGMIVTGSYTGTGSETKTFDLGFRPVFLMIFAEERFPIDTVSSSPPIIYHAFATGNKTTKGIDTTSSGFKVYNNSSAASSSGVLHLNDLGKTYCYFAVRPT